MKFLVFKLMILVMLYSCSGIHTIKKSSVKISSYSFHDNSPSLDLQIHKGLNDAIQFVDSLLRNDYGFTMKYRDSQLINRGSGLTYARVYFKENSKQETLVSFASKKNRLKITLYDRQIWFKDAKYFKEFLKELRRKLEAKFGKEAIA